MDRTAVITAGPTRSRLDAVRFIMNTSSGALGRVLAEEGLLRGYDVHHLHGPFSLLPRLDRRMSGRLLATEISWIDELLPALRTTGMAINPTVIFHAMAVLDYLPDTSSLTKRPSGTSWEISLKPNRKIIDLLPEIFPGSMLIGFKLETRISQECLVERAGKLARRSNAELIVANLLEWVDGDSYRCILVDKDDNIIESIRGREELSRFLWNFIESFRT